MDYEFWKLAFQVFTFLVSAGVGIYLHLALKDKVTNDRIERLEDDLNAKIEGQSERVATLEERSLNGPSHADIAKLYESINSLSRTVHTMNGKMESQSDTLRLILSRITERGMQ